MNQFRCPETDLLVEDISGFNGNFDGHIEADKSPNIWSNKFVLDNPQELTFSATYINSGSYNANNSTIAWYNMDMNALSKYVDVEDFELLCE